MMHENRQVLMISSSLNGVLRKLCSLRSPFILNGVAIIIFFKEIILEKGMIKKQPITESALLVNTITGRFPYPFSFESLKGFLFESLINEHSISLFHLFIVRFKNQLFDSENFSIKPLMLYT